jgi:hypothetical protein
MLRALQGQCRHGNVARMDISHGDRGAAGSLRPEKFAPFVTHEQEFLVFLPAPNRFHAGLRNTSECGTRFPAHPLARSHAVCH